MALSPDAILDMATTVTATIEFSEDIMGKRTYNAVTKALTQGYIATRGGQAAKYYDLLTTHYKLPSMVFSRGARWWDGMTMRGLPDECAAPLSEFFTADRVLFRMEEPEKYNQAVDQRIVGYNSYRDALKEPDFVELIKKSRRYTHSSMRILHTKEVMYFDAIAKEYLQTQSYKDGLAQALKLLKDGGTMTYKIKGGA